MPSPSLQALLARAAAALERGHGADAAQMLAPVLRSTLPRDDELSVRAMLADRGVKSVAADGFAAPGVVVCFTDDPEIQNGRRFAAQGLQIAAGVPLMIDEGPEYRSFRIGLFGLDKLKDVPASLARLETAFDVVFPRGG